MKLVADLEKRFPPPKVVGPVHEVGKGLELRGQLDKQTPALVYQVKLAAGKTYVIDMVSPDQKALDPYLVLMDATGKKLAEDDDSGGGRNAPHNLPRRAGRHLPRPGDRVQPGRRRLHPERARTGAGTARAEEIATARPRPGPAADRSRANDAPGGKMPCGARLSRAVPR